MSALPSSAISEAPRRTRPVAPYLVPRHGAPFGQCPTSVLLTPRGPHHSHSRPLGAVRSTLALSQGLSPPEVRTCVVLRFGLSRVTFRPRRQSRVIYSPTAPDGCLFGLRPFHTFNPSPFAPSAPSPYPPLRPIRPVTHPRPSPISPSSISPLSISPPSISPSTPSPCPAISLFVSSPSDPPHACPCFCQFWLPTLATGRIGCRGSQCRGLCSCRAQSPRVPSLVLGLEGGGIPPWAGSAPRACPPFARGHLDAGAAVTSIFWCPS